MLCSFLRSVNSATNPLQLCRNQWKLLGLAATSNLLSFFLKAVKYIRSSGITSHYSMAAPPAKMVSLDLLNLV